MNLPGSAEATGICVAVAAMVYALTSACLLADSAWLRSRVVTTGSPHAETRLGRSGVHLFGFGLLVNAAAVMLRLWGAERDPWGWPEWLVLVCLLVSASCILLINDYRVRQWSGWVAAALFVGLVVAAIAALSP